MGYQNVSWWKKNGRRFNMSARKLTPRSGSFSQSHMEQYAKKQTHPVLAVDHGHGRWTISDGSTTVKARAKAGKKVYGYVVPASAFAGASSGCLLVILTFGIYPLITRMRRK